LYRYQPKPKHEQARLKALRFGCRSGILVIRPLFADTGMDAQTVNRNPAGDHDFSGNLRSVTHFPLNVVYRLNGILPGPPADREKSFRRSVYARGSA
jgi:hypothetical protein